MTESCTGEQSVNHIEPKCEKRWKPPVAGCRRLEQTNQQDCEEDKEAKSQNRLTLMRGNESMNRECGGADADENPPNALGSRAT